MFGSGAGGRRPCRAGRGGLRSAADGGDGSAAGNEGPPRREGQVQQRGGRRGRLGSEERRPAAQRGADYGAPGLAGGGREGAS